MKRKAGRNKAHLATDLTAVGTLHLRPYNEKENVNTECVTNSIEKVKNASSAEFNLL